MATSLAQIQMVLAIYGWLFLAIQGRLIKVVYGRFSMHMTYNFVRNT